MRELETAEAFEFYRSFLEFHCRWFQPRRYLDIGLAKGETFQRLIPYCMEMRGVDPVLPPMGALDLKCRLFGMTSDQYFKENPDEQYDLVFIDGFHEHQQLLRDVRHSLDRLLTSGVIMAHDSFPPSPALTDAANCGDAYKAIIDLRGDRSLEAYTIPVTYGLTLIGKIGTQFPWTFL